jgi:thymidylate synthase
MIPLYQDRKYKEIIEDIRRDGCLDKNPRPVWIDRDESGKEIRTPAHTLSVNHRMISYDLSKGQIPLITLRPIAWKKSINELLWIYQSQTNSLDVLENEYDIHWWNEWDVGDRTIGQRYGQTVRDHDLMNNLIDGIKRNPDGRRHILSLWQDDDFEKPGLNPCAFMTIWNVRHGKDGVDYLDMMLVQRSSDFIVAGCINQFQYSAFLCMLAHVLGYKPGQFTWCVDNVQIYDRHMDAAEKILERESVPCQISIEINPDVCDWYDYKPGDVKVVGYPIDEIKKQNPQIKLQLAV